jgi:hypothetical protein
MHFIFGFIVFLFFLLRTLFRWSWRRGRRLSSYARTREVFDDLVRQYGGSVQRLGWRRISYLTYDKFVELQIDSEAHRLTLYIRKPVASRFNFYRFPRLVYAFLDAFLEPRYRLDRTHYLVGSNSAQMLETLQTRQGFLPLMQKLDEHGFSGRMGSQGIKLWKRILPDEISEFSFSAYIRLARDLAQISEAELIRIPVQQIDSEKRCAYCKELLGPGESVQYCQSCGTPHHKECFELNGSKCTVYGCEQPVPQPELQV